MIVLLCIDQMIVTVIPIFTGDLAGGIFHAQQAILTVIGQAVAALIVELATIGVVRERWITGRPFR
ncbi:hypothetical protein D3C75_1322610 [compost metagenome]